MNPRAPRSRVDANQREIVAALEHEGVVVQDMSGAAEGFNDLFCAIPGILFLIEVKMPGKKLNPSQKKWHARMPWNNHVAYSIADALAIVEFYRQRKTTNGK